MGLADCGQQAARRLRAAADRGRYTSLVLMGLVGVASCTKVLDLCETGNRLTIPHEALRLALIQDLRDAEIHFHVDSIGTVCYQPEQSDTIQARFADLIEARASEREVEVQKGEHALRMIVALTSEGIGFSYLEQDDRVVLVIEQTVDVPRVKALALDAARAIERKEPFPIGQDDDV